MRTEEDKWARWAAIGFTILVVLLALLGGKWWWQ